MLNGQQQEPYEGRSSRTVLWERRGEVPLRDPMCATNASSGLNKDAMLCER